MPHAETVARLHVRADVTYLVIAIAADWHVDSAGESIDDLHEEAREMISPILDWEAAARAYGKLVTWEEFVAATDRPEGLLERAQQYHTDGATHVFYDPNGDAEGDMLVGDLSFMEENVPNLVDIFDGIEKFQRPIAGHFAITTWLADHLEPHGERISRDFSGLTIWSPTVEPITRLSQLFDDGGDPRTYHFDFAAASNGDWPWYVVVGEGLDPRAVERDGEWRVYYDDFRALDAEEGNGDLMEACASVPILAFRQLGAIRAGLQLMRKQVEGGWKDREALAVATHMGTRAALSGEEITLLEDSL